MSKAILAAAVATIPALVVGSIAGGVAGGVVGLGSGSIASACGASDETTENVIVGAGTVTYYGVGGYVAYKIIKGTYDAFDDE